MRFLYLLLLVLGVPTMYAVLSSFSAAPNMRTTTSLWSAETTGTPETTEIHTHSAPAAQSAQEAALTTWNQGRPQEALPLFLHIAKKQNQWHDWFNAGLCAQAAQETGIAHAALLQAAQLAPWQSAPRQALRQYGVDIPVSWGEWFGPFTIPGNSWAAPAIAFLAGLCLVYAGLRRKRRLLMITLSTCGIMTILPGIIAQLDNSLHAYAAVAQDSSLRDTTGNAIQTVPAGTIVRITVADVFPGRDAVILPDGQAGHLPNTAFQISTAAP